MDDRQALYVQLNLIPDIGSTQWRRLLDAFGEVEHIHHASAQDLQQLGGVTPRLARRIVDGIRDKRSLDNDLNCAQRAGVAIVTLADSAYPRLLRLIPDPPLALYVKGSLESQAPAIAMVGSRQASVYGVQCAQQLAAELAARGLTVISGLARGVDAWAHRGALRTGRTWAVLGCGLGRVYPPEHEPLAADIVERGALISEYPMQTAPLPRHFPRRNRLISGLAFGVVVVEAGPRSGALITVDCALEQGREVFAVPGPITTATSQGTNRLLQQGAKLITSVDDILEDMGSVAGLLRQAGLPDQVESMQGKAKPAAEATNPVELPENQRRVFQCLRADEPALIDVIVADSGLAVAQVSSALIELELRRLVRQLPGQQFLRVEAM